MYTVILFMLIGILVCWRFGRNIFSEGLRFDILVLAFIMVIAHGVLGAIIAVWIGVGWPRTVVEEGRYPLAAMNAAPGTTGEFFLGTGGLGSATVYRVLIREPDGSFRHWSHTANWDDTRIVEYANLYDGGLLIIRGKVPVSDWTWSNWAFTSKRPVYPTYEFRVPPGSVRTTFDVSP